MSDERGFHFSRPIGGPPAEPPEVAGLRARIAELEAETLRLRHEVATLKQQARVDRIMARAGEPS